MTMKLVLFLAVSACAIALSYSQSCSNEGAQVSNYCGDTCYCIGGQIQNCCRVRKEFTSMTEAERILYVSTVLRASTELQFQKEYHELISLHRRLFPTGIHQKDQFLPWHRWYILKYENLLRRVDCRVTVPYWDWSIVSMTPWHTDTTRVWYGGPSGLGGNGVIPSRCIQNGVFRENAWTKTDGRCLTRDFNGFTPDVIAVYLTLLHPPTTDGFDIFEGDLRINLHDTVHCRVGGDMCLDTSAEAPEFFLHHGFIDKIWSDWQEKSRGHLTVHFCNMTSLMIGTGYRAGDFLDNLNLPDIERPGWRTCVLYDDPTQPVYREVMQRLHGMTREQILAIPRHSFKPLTDQQMRFFNISPQEQSQARQNLRELEPRNELKGEAGLTGVDREIGFRVASLPANNGRKRSILARKKKVMRERWMAENSL